MFRYANFIITFLFVFLLILQLTLSKPLDDKPSDITDKHHEVNSIENDEIMQTAAGTNPFLPKFAMQRIKERRAMAQRRRAEYRRHYMPQQRPRFYRPSQRCN